MVSRLSKCCAKFFFGISTVSSFFSTSLREFIDYKTSMTTY